MPLVYYGNHRTIAVIILTKRGSIPANTVVGEHSGGPLTAGELVNLYDQDELMTANSNSKGVPWFSDSKVRDIVANFKRCRAVQPQPRRWQRDLVGPRRRAPVSEHEGRSRLRHAGRGLHRQRRLTRAAGLRRLTIRSSAFRSIRCASTTRAQPAPRPTAD